MRAWVEPRAIIALVRATEHWLLAGAVALCATGFWIGFRVSPAGLGGDEFYRIVCVHVPSTWTALLLYALLVLWSSLRLLTGLQVASMMAEAIAPTGALFALLALWTGSLWSKAASDMWWDWDTRRLADLTLLASFVACVLLREAIDEVARCDAMTAAIAFAGAGVAVFLLAPMDLMPGTGSHPDARASALGARMIASLFVIAAGFVTYSTAVVLKRLRCVILERTRAHESIEQCEAWR